MLTPIIELSEEVIGKICYGIDLGADFEVACMSAGVMPETAASWIRTGMEKKEGLEYALYFLVMQTRASFEVSQLEFLKKNGGVTEAKYMLEKTNPGKWSESHQKATGKKKPKKIEFQG